MPHNTRTVSKSSGKPGVAEMDGGSRGIILLLRKGGRQREKLPRDTGVFLLPFPRRMSVPEGKEMEIEVRLLPAATLIGCFAPGGRQVNQTGHPSGRTRIHTSLFLLLGGFSSINQPLNLSSALLGMLAFQRPLYQITPPHTHLPPCFPSINNSPCGSSVQKLAAHWRQQLFILYGLSHRTKVILPTSNLFCPNQIFLNINVVR